MKKDDTIILSGYPDPNRIFSKVHEKACDSLQVIPTVTFASIHDIDRDLTLTRLPCSIETARRWVLQMQQALGERYKTAGIKEI